MLQVTNPRLRVISGAIGILALVAIVLNYTWTPVQNKILIYALVAFAATTIVFLRTASLVTCQVCGWRGAVAPWEDPKHCPGCREAEDEMAYRR